MPYQVNIIVLRGKMAGKYKSTPGQIVSGLIEQVRWFAVNDSSSEATMVTGLGRRIELKWSACSLGSHAL